MFPYWAWAPSYELDMVAVVRHARHARRLGVERDALLTGIFLGTTAATCYLLDRLGALWLAVVIGVSAFAAVGFTFGSASFRRRTERLLGDVWSVLFAAFIVLVLATAAVRSIGWGHGLSM